MIQESFKILVADTDEETLSWTCDVLQEEGINVLTTSDPGETLRLIESGEFDLLIFDIKIYAQLVHHNFRIESRDERDVPIIVLTTDEDFELTVSAIKEGAVDFLDKPIRVKRLLISIRNALMHSSKVKQLKSEQEELSSLKDLYEHIIHGIDYGLVVLDQNLRIESINEHQKRKHRTAESEAIGAHCFDYFYDRPSTCEDCRVKEVFEKGAPVRYNVTNKAIGGTSYFLEVEAFPLYSPQGEVTRVVQLIKDVTERVLLERELRLQKEYLENLFANAPIGIFTTDREGFIRTANPAFANLLGVDEPRDAVGLNVLEADDFKKAQLDVGFRSVLQAGTPFENESVQCEAIGRHNSICAIRCVPLRGSESEIIGLIATVADVTEKWKLEEHYLKRITELSIFKEIGELFQSSNELEDIYSIALIGVTAGHGLGFNRAFLLRYDSNANILHGEKAVGPADAEEAAQIWEEFHVKDLTLKEIYDNYKSDPDTHDIKLNEITREIHLPITWEGGFIQEVLFKCIPMRITSDQFAEYDDLEHLTAALRCQEFAAAPLISRGRTEGLIIADNSITGEDISDEDVNRLSIITNQAGVAIENSQLLNSLEEKVEALRQAYLDLKKNRDLRLRAERLSVVGEVAASVAHEIRNPLTSIGGFTRAVLRDLENIEKTRTNRRFLTIILEEVKRLERIVNEILEFVRPVMPRYENANLNEVIEETFNMMAGEIDESRIVISKDYQDDLSLVWMDPDQIRQVLLNLLQNAIHAIEETGMLSVITEGDTRNVRVHISDTGHGIPAENREKLFTAFFTTKSTGSGLGLTVSNQIIKNHGGSIEVESSRGEGSTFVITLPVQSQEETNEEENLGRRRRTEPADSL
jgi:PAS domain S-box-containing protein